MKKLIQIAILTTALFTAQGQAMETESVNTETLVSEIGACMLNQEQQIPVDDPVYFTIRNETHADVPVKLRIRYFQPLHIIDLFQGFKSVKAHSESYFRQSECIRFKEEIDAYIAPEPDDFNFQVTISFNMENMRFNGKNINPDSLSGAIGHDINPCHVPYGRTYIIKPNNHVTSSEVMVKSFKIKLID